MSNVVRYLSKSDDALRNFVDQWSRDPAAHADVRQIEWPLQNASKLAFISHEGPLEELREREILQDFLPVYRGMSNLPLMGEVEEPIFIQTTRKRIQHVWFHTTKHITYCS
jgi:hypothetical protein